jgi:hypothetical protein
MCTMPASNQVEKQCNWHYTEIRNLHTCKSLIQDSKQNGKAGVTRIVSSETRTTAKMVD